MNEIKLICFDMDDTLIDQNSWYKLNIALGVTPEEDQQMYDDYVGGSLSYQEWTAKLLALYAERKLATKDTISNILSEYTLKEGAKDLVLYLQQRGYILVIISGSFDILVRQVAEELGIKYFKANTNFEFDSRNYLKSIQSGGDEAHAKLNHLGSFCDQLGVSILECVCIGDGANDLELFKKTQKGITFIGAPEVISKVAWHTVNQLTDIKNLL